MAHLKPLLILIVVGFILLGIEGCKPSEDGTKAPKGVAMRVVLPDNVQVGAADIEIFLLKDNAPVTGATITVTGDMTHAGMVPVESLAPATSPGLYQTQDFTFTMAGDWVLTTVATLPDGKKATTVTPLTVKR